MPFDTSHLGNIARTGASGISLNPVLRQRLRDMGIVLLSCTESGELLAPAPPGEDWLVRLFIGSSMFRAQLRSAAQQWNAQEDPQPVPCMAGCPGAGVWLAPTPVVNRRRRVGF